MPDSASSEPAAAPPSARLLPLLRRDLARTAKLLLIPPAWIAATAWRNAAESRAFSLVEGLPLLAVVFLGGAAVLLVKDLLPGPDRDELLSLPVERRDILLSKLVTLVLLAAVGITLVAAAFVVFRRAVPAAPSIPPSVSAPAVVAGLAIPDLPEVPS